jgi:hypothetical protein
MGGGLTLETLCVIMRSLSLHKNRAFIRYYKHLEPQVSEAFIRLYSQQYSQLILNNKRLIENELNNTLMFFNILI